jgi:hypothetical protein
MKKKEADTRELRQPARGDEALPIRISEGRGGSYAHSGEDEQNGREEDWHEESVEKENR